MRYLLDTNIFLYFATDIQLLDKNVLSILEDAENTLYLSVESLKELVQFFRKQKIKPKQWKTEIELLNAVEKDFGISILPLKKEHLHTYAKLSINLVQDHKDPSDHIIISQAITDKITLISSDRKFEFYQKQHLKFIFNSK
ncbi:MAG: type II toxin-antitoxin system VapC family toxin [Paludibacter sp.]